MWYHYSAELIAVLKTHNLRGVIRYKPRKSFWLAKDDTWAKSGIIDNSSYTTNYKYRVLIDRGANIIRIHTQNCKDFTERYSTERGTIDWGKVQKDGFDGVEVTSSALSFVSKYVRKNMADKVDGNKYLWIQTFLVPSLAIWNVEAIKSFRLVENEHTSKR
jgi:hypothetical protein